MLLLMLIILVHKCILLYFFCFTDQPLLSLLIIKWIMYLYLFIYFVIYFFATHRNYYYFKVKKWKVYVAIVIYIVYMYVVTLKTKTFCFLKKSIFKIFKHTTLLIVQYEYFITFFFL